MGEPGASVPELLDRLHDDLAGRGALVGPHGHGKTTLLEAMGRALSSAGRDVRWLRLTAETSRPRAEAWRAATAALDGRSAVLVDGAEQLSWWRWRRLERAARHAGILLVTTHATGRLPTLHVHRAPAAALEPVLGQLLPPETIERCLPRAHALLAAHAGNVREVLRALYDDWA